MYRLPAISRHSRKSTFRSISVKRGTRFGPAQILALSPVAWFRWGVGITVATGVSQWSDQSGAGHHLLQATAGSQPALQGDNSILFDGVAKSLKCTGFALIQPETVYLLMNPVSWTVTRFMSDGNVLNTGGVVQDKTGGVGTTPSVTQFAGAYGGNDLTHATVGAYHVIGAVFNGASSGVFVDGNTMQTGSAGAANMGGFTLGCRADSSLFSNIQVKEAIVFPAAHAPDVRAKVIGYLARLGGISV